MKEKKHDEAKALPVLFACKSRINIIIMVLNLWWRFPERELLVFTDKTIKKKPKSGYRVIQSNEMKVKFTAQRFYENSE